MAGKIRLVVLDWAGTTIDYGCQAPAGAFVEAFARAGVTVSIPEARGPMGLHKKDHIRTLLRLPEIGQRWESAHGRPWTEADVQALYEVVTPMQIEAAKKHSELVPGTVEAVAQLRALGCKIAATTGYFHAAAEACYEAGRRQGYVPDFAICADEVPAGRPAPWMIFRAMEALNIYPPSSVVKVGDTIVDIEDGLNAGAWSLGVVESSNEMGLSRGEFEQLAAEEREERRRAIRTRYERAGAHACLNSIRDLPDWVERQV
jgi:phosphonoacetaldehyde hydrolase